jgi:hypothetical protein
VTDEEMMIDFAKMNDALLADLAKMGVEYG